MLLHCKLICLFAMGYKRGREVSIKINFRKAPTQEQNKITWEIGGKGGKKC